MALSDDQRPELLRDVTHEIYHRDAFPGGPRLSRSVALTLVQKASPLHAWYSHPRLGGMLVEENTDATDNGSLIHALLLGTGAEVVVADFPDWRTKAAQAIRDEARGRGAVPILAGRWEEIKVATSIIRKRIETLGVPLDDCEKEVTILWDDNGTQCKARMDLLCLAGNFVFPSDDAYQVTSARIWDLKVTALSPDRWKRGMIDYGHDIQAHAYTKAVEAVYPQIAGRVDFGFILCEPEPPHDVALVPAGESMLTLGGMRWGRALRIWRKCLACGDWPGYGLQAPAEAKPWDIENELVAGGAELVDAGDPAWVSGEAKDGTEV